MKNKIKTLVKLVIPLFLLKMISKKTRKYGFFGNYKTWQEASNDSLGYTEPIILEKVKNSLLKVKDGKAIYERDSVLFDQIQYSWPLLASLLWIASRNDNHLKLIDFGGSLGSSYFQNIGFLKHLKELSWNIIEQKKFVACGKEYFENDKLKFYESIEDCLQKVRPHAILILGTVQYLERPYDFLERIVGLGFEYAIFDRTMFLKNINMDRITIQKVSPRIYAANYPAWFLNEKKFLDIFSQKYSLVESFISLAGEIILDDNTKAVEKGFIFKIK